MTREEIKASFEELKWHDLSLLNTRTERYGDYDAFVIEITDTYNSDKGSFEVLFHDTTYLSMTVDFASKRDCADAVSGGVCSIESPWKTSVIEANPYDNFAEYLHFELNLIPKGGSINLLAMTFEITRTQ